MKLLLPLVVGLFVIVQSGCNGDSDSSNSANPGTPGTAVASPAPSPSNSSIWSQISERTSCALGTNSDCIGNYGFTVLNDGHYQVGPAPGGLLLSGSLAAGEIDLMNQDATSVAGGTPDGRVHLRGH